jgi:hypothetical protein
MRTDAPANGGVLIERALLGHRGAALYYDCRAAA